MRSSGSRLAAGTHRLAVLATALMAALGAGACKKDVTPSVVRLVTSSVPECPGDGFRFTADTGHGITIQYTEVPWIGNRTDIPEFHDCQRFVKNDGTYDVRYAIFAPPTARVLDSIWSADSAAHPWDGSGLPARLLAAVIYSWEGTYAPLGIEPDFNCLMMYQQNGQWQATMLKIGTVVTCPERVTGPLQAGETQLATNEMTPPRSYVAADYPDVARWDWDAQNKLQYISIKCAPIWCEISASASYTASTAMASTATFPSNAGPTTPDDNQRRRTVEIRGWYDEQQLAMVGATGLTPGPVHGIVWPAKALGRYDQASQFHFPYVHSAYARVSDDYVKGGRTLLHRGDSRIGLCSGSASECHVNTATLPSKCTTGTWTWWAKIEPPTGSPYYTCVTYMEHAGYDIPAAVRWRWDASDETVWIRCTAGCCKLET